MHNEVTPILIIHAFAGVAMLLSGIVAMGARKANRAHRTGGKIYLYASIIVSITGFIIAVQNNNQFLIATSVFVMYMILTAYRSLFLKQLHKEVKASLIDWLIIAFAIIASTGLLVLGIISIARENYAGFVPLLFGLISATFIRRDILKFTKGPVEENHWLLNHIRGMVGSYIAGVTAFLAVNAGFISNHFSLIVWMAPTAIGFPLIVIWVKKYKRKSNDLQQELGLKIRTNEPNSNQEKEP